MKPLEAVFTHAAHEDLLNIWCYIAKDNVTAADGLEMSVREAVAQLAVMPDLGHRRRDLTGHDVWFHTVWRNYLIVYHVGERLEVVRVLHGARDAARELAEL